MGAHHLIIAGTGRAGTTVLVELLAACGLDTGSDQMRYFARSNAGLERAFDPDTSPYVVKNPYLSDDLPRLLEEGLDPSLIDAVIVPVRDLDDAANSRIAVFAAHGLRAPGGLWREQRPSRQRALLAESFYRLVTSASDHGIRVVTLSFPDFVDDPEYAWRSLDGVLPGVDHATFLDVFRATVRRELVTAPPRPGRAGLLALDARWMLQRSRLRGALALRRLTGRGPGDPRPAG